MRLFNSKLSYFILPRKHHSEYRKEFISFLTSSKDMMNEKIQLKKNYPIRYWIVFTLFGFIDNLKENLNIFEKLKRYYSNKYVYKTHILSSKKLKPGKWYDMDYRIEMCLFDSMIDFISLELAHSNYNFNLKPNERNLSAGLDYLQQDMKLVKGEEYPEKDRGKPLPQAISAKKLFDIYTWCEERYSKQDILLEQCKNISERIKLTDQLEKETTKALVELVKLRGYMWT